MLQPGIETIGGAVANQADECLSERDCLVRLGIIPAQLGQHFPVLFSGFIYLRETEADQQRPVLLLHSPGAGKVESFAQPQHGFEPPDRASCRMEGLKAADPRHGLLNPEVVALDPLLQVLGDVMQWILRQEPVFPGGRDGRRIGGTGPVCADPVRRKQELVPQHLAEEALGRLQVALRR
jgi:hypothetical protein